MSGARGESNPDFLLAKQDVFPLDERPISVPDV